MAKLRKISDKEFLTILRENAGLYARTGRAIQKQFNITYSRQAVRDRADNHKDEYADILEETVDVAEEGLHSLMRSKNEAVKLRACELFLKTKGKHRGYIERSEITGKDGTALMPPRIEVEIITNNDRNRTTSDENQD